MAIAANIGDVAILDFPAFFPDSIVGLAPHEGVDLFFLYRLMQAMKSPMLMTATISTQMNLNVEQIISLSAPRPPLVEQKAIVEHIDAECSALEEMTFEAQRAIDLLEERRSALISAAVTGKIDVRGLVKPSPDNAPEKP
jgi:type I restriction enzyme S subunit